jgi:uncharacterized protein (DUF58 family)
MASPSDTQQPPPHRRRAQLAQPAAKQGPGAMPPALLDALAIAVTQRVAGALPGDRRAAGVGAGTELAQIRPYAFGDDVRRIDAATTARTGEPHVRLEVPERTLTTWLALDVSSSMAFGTAERLKADVAEGVMLAVGRLALRHAGRVGIATFGDGDTRVQPPRGSKAGQVALRRTLNAGVARDGVADPHALADALGRVGRVARLPGLVVVVSDFRDQRDWARPLGVLRSRHAVLAVEVHDPREASIPPVGRIAVVDPETGRRVEVDTSRLRVREKFAAIEAERRESLASELRRLRVDHAALSTDEDWLLQLGRRLR